MDGMTAKPKKLKPYYQDEFITLYCGDVREILPQLEKNIAQTCVTSPPYYNLRDYGTATWIGGDPDCDHIHTRGHQGKTGQRADRTFTQPIVFKDKCGKCGGLRIDRQIGLEKTPAEFVQTMVDVFGHVRGTLRADGTLWMNMGDSYANDGKWGGNSSGKNYTSSAGRIPRSRQSTGLKPKDLMGMPWRTAFGLQDDGWWLRQDNIWDKPNPMPESVQDRCTKAHEYIFLLAQAVQYYYDAEAIKEPASPNTNPRRAALDKSKPVGGWAYGADDHTAIAHTRPKNSNRKLGDHGSGIKNNASFDEAMKDIVPNRNKRSVWKIPTQPYSEAHFATFPKSLPETCIKAGTSEKGQCSSCGKPFERIVEKATSFESGSGRSGNEISGKGSHVLDDGNKELRKGPVNATATVGWQPSGKGRDRSNGNRNGEGASTMDGSIPQTLTVGWSETCCDGATIEPQTVLDPFAGAGTTLIVAKLLGRRSIGIELNPEYCDLIVKRIKKETIVAPGDRGMIEQRTKTETVLPLFSSE